MGEFFSSDLIITKKVYSMRKVVSILNANVEVKYRTVTSMQSEISEVIDNREFQNENQFPPKKRKLI